MKALSVRAPWWWAILHGKPVENRDWHTSQRGRILLHASKFWKIGEVSADWDCVKDMAAQDNLALPLPVGNVAAVELCTDIRNAGGCLVGSVEIIDCVTSHPSTFFVGKFGFVLRNPITFDTPIPFKGALGFFDVPDSLVPSVPTLESEGADFQSRRGGELKKLFACDLFCGAGGTSTGMAEACRDLGIQVDLLAIDHWQIAIDTHTASHPWARHMCAAVDHINPRDVVPGGRLQILCASPECTNHSIARGGRPINDQSRATAWHILKWCQELYIDNLLIENVREFRDWGPIGANGKPLKSRRGETFRAFIEALKSLGYNVEHRILNAADYGDPTTRERLFIIGRRGGKQIHWPEQTHSPKGQTTLFGTTKAYRTARKDVIDWELPNPSIFSRKKPLAPTTMARIIAGLAKFNPSLEPFIVTLRGGLQNMAAARSVDSPVPTGLIEPYLVPIDQQGGGEAGTRSVDEPIPTITTKARVALAEPFITKYYGTAEANTVDAPLDTLPPKDRFGLVQPEFNGFRLDIRFRMLQPHELARAQGFPEDYKFTGTKSDIVKQIGNAVPVNLARSLIASLLADYKGKRKEAVPELVKAKAVTA